MGLKKSKLSNLEVQNVLPPSQSPNHIDIPIGVNTNDCKFMFIGNHTFLIPTVKLNDVMRKMEYRDDWIPIQFMIGGKDGSKKVMAFGHSDSLVIIVTEKFKIYCAGKSSELNSVFMNNTWRDFKTIHNTLDDFVDEIHCIKESALFVTKTERSVYAFSNSKLAKLGLGETTTVDPMKLKVAHQITKGHIEEIEFPKIKSIAFSENITAFLTEEGKVLVCGYGKELRFPIKDESEQPFQRLDTPTLIKSLLKDKIITQVACGDHHMLFLTNNGELYVCGQGEKGQLGNGKQENVEGAVKRVKFGLGVKFIAAQRDFSVIVTENDQVWRFGDLEWQVKNKPFIYPLPQLLTEYNDLGNPPVKKIVAIHSATIIHTMSDDIYIVGPLDYKLGYAGFRRIEIPKPSLNTRVKLHVASNSMVCEFLEEEQ